MLYEYIEKCTEELPIFYKGKYYDAAQLVSIRSKTISNIMSCFKDIDAKERPASVL
jgi:hypothetical protein